MKQKSVVKLLAFLIAVSAFLHEKSYPDQRVEDARIYNEANEVYSSKDYQNALELYIELIERGVKNPYLYYNLGNTYYKLGQIGYAILYYEKAISLKPFDRDARENLEYVRRSLKERIIPVYNESLFKFMRISYSYIKPILLILLELFFFTGFILFMLLSLFIPYSRNKFKRYIALFAVLFVIFGILAFAHRTYEKNHPKGIVVEREIEVLTAPIAESEIIFPLYEGTKAKLLESRGEWIRITLDDGREGWTPSQSVIFI